MSNFWLPVVTLWQRELVRFWRQKSRVLGVVASPLVFWLLIGSGSGDLGRFFAGALVCLFLALRPNPEAADASGGRVETVEGAIGKRHYYSSGGNSSEL